MYWKIIGASVCMTLLAASGYAAWYSYAREQVIERNQSCAHRIPSPSGDLVCVQEIVPPTLWEKFTRSDNFVPLSQPQNLNQSATTTPQPRFVPDTSLGNGGVRLIAPDNPYKVSAWSASSWVFVEKNREIHGEVVYDSEIVSQASQYFGDTVPRFVSGGIIYTDESGVTRKFHLADLMTLPNISNPDSFDFIPGSEDYIKDKEHVYFLKFVGGAFFDPTSFVITVIPGADPNTIHILNNDALLAADNHAVYQNGEVVVDVDISSFSEAFLGSKMLFKDTHRIYRFSAGPSVSIANRNGVVERFSLEETFYKHVEDGSSLYSVRAEGVYYNDQLIQEADAKSFVLLSGYLGLAVGKDEARYDYARDSTRVYYMGMPIPNADVKTFQPIENGAYGHSYAADARHVFYHEKEILGADLKSFFIMWHTVYEGCTLGAYSRDAQYVYFQDAAVPGADPQTFEALINGYGKDTRGIYLNGEFQSDLPKSFEPTCNYG